MSENSRLVSRSELKLVIAQHFHEADTKLKKIFVVGETLKGKTAVLRSISAGYCKKLNENEWDYWKKRPECLHELEKLNSAGEKLPSVLMDFSQHQSLVPDKFAMIMRTALRDQVKFPLFDFALRMHLKELGGGIKTQLKNLFLPAVRLGLLATGVASIPNPGDIVKGLATTFRTAKEIANVGPSTIQEIKGQAGTQKLLARLPEFLAKDLSAFQGQMGLLFDNHQCFYNEAYSPGQIKNSDRWFRGFINSLKITGLIVVTGERPPLWQDCSDPLKGFEVCHLTGLTKPEAIRLLRESGVPEDSFESLIKAFSGEDGRWVHPYLLREFLNIEQPDRPAPVVFFTSKGRALADQLLKSSPKSVYDVLIALCPLDVFNSEILRHLIKDLELDSVSFADLKEHQFVRKVTGGFQVRHLIRRLVSNDSNYSSSATIASMIKFHEARVDEDINRLELIRFLSAKSNEEGAKEWLKQFRASRRTRNYEHCKHLLGLRGGLRFSEQEMAESCLVEANYYLCTGQYGNVEKCVEMGEIAPQSAAYILGRLFSETSNFERAREKLEAAFDESQVSLEQLTEVGLELAKLHFVQGHFNEARATLDKLEKQLDQSEEGAKFLKRVLVTRGQVELLDSRLHSASKILEDSLNIKERSSPYDLFFEGRARRLLAIIDFELGNSERAGKSIAAALAAFEESAFRHFEVTVEKSQTLLLAAEIVADEASASQFIEKAEFELQEARRLGENRTPVLIEVAYLRAILGDFFAAKGQKKKASKNFQAAHSGFNLATVEAGRAPLLDVYKGHVYVKEAKVECEPRKAIALFEKGLERYKDAQQSGYRSTSLYNDFADAQSYLGARLMECGELDAAKNYLAKSLKEFRRLSTERPDLPTGFSGQAQASFLLGELELRQEADDAELSYFEEARCQVQKAIEIASKKPHLLSLAATISIWLAKEKHRRHGSNAAAHFYQEAIEKLRDAVQASPDDEDLKFRLGFALVTLSTAVTERKKPDFDCALDLCKECSEIENQMKKSTLKLKLQPLRKLTQAKIHILQAVQVLEDVDHSHNLQNTLEQLDESIGACGK